MANVRPFPKTNRAQLTPAVDRSAARVLNFERPDHFKTDGSSKHLDAAQHRTMDVLNVLQTLERHNPEAFEVIYQNAKLLVDEA